MVKKKEVSTKKESSIKKEHHIAKKKHSYPRLILLLVLLVFLGLVVLPVLLQEKVIEVPESIPILKPSPPPEEEEVPAEEFPEDVEEIEKPVVKPSKKEVVIKRYSLEPDKVVIEEGIVVSWVNDDTRRHKIVCYINKRRIFVGEILFNKGDKSEYKFKDSGEYLCLDAVFGLRMSVIVKPMSLSRITGGVVRNILTENVILVGLLVFALLLAVSVPLYVNKRT